jgi:hypothetical protein
MEIVLFLIGVVLTIMGVFSIFIVPIIVISLMGRVKQLEQQIYSVSHGISQISSQRKDPASANPHTSSFLSTLAPTHVEQPNTTTENAIEQPIPASHPPKTITTPAVIQQNKTITPSFSLYNWLKQDFFVKLGGLFVILAGVWFVSYTFTNDIIGEQGRVSLGLLAGCGLLGLGYFQLQKRRNVGTVLTVSGTTTIIASLWSATSLFSLFTPTIAFAGMILTLALTILISILRKHQFLAVFSLLASYLVPFITGSQSESSMPLFTYLIIVSVAMYVITFFTKWRILQTITMIALGLFSPILYADQSINPWLILIPSIALLYGTSITSILRSKSIVFLDIINSIISTFLMNIWVIVFVQPDLRVITLSLIAVATFGLSLLFHTKSIGSKLVNIQLVSSITLLTIATCLQFYEQLYILAIIISLEAVAIQWLINKTLGYTLHYTPFAIAQILPYAIYLSQRLANSNSEQLIPYLIASVILGLLLNLNSIIIQVTTKSSAGFKKLSSLLTAGSLVYATHAIFGFIDYIIPTLAIPLDGVTNGVYPLLALAFTAAGLAYIHHPATSNDAILRSAGNIITIFGLGFLTIALASTTPYFMFGYLLCIWAIAGFIEYIPSVQKQTELSVYSVATLVGAFMFQVFNVVQNANDIMKIMFYLIYISILLFWITKPSQYQHAFLSQLHKITMGAILFLLVFVELWSIGIVIRIVTFIIIGILFISTGFLKKPKS